MRKQAFICVLLAAVLLPGCSEDGENTPQSTDGRVALEATSGIRMNTRAYDNTWESGDANGIYMLNDDATDGNGNHKYTTAETAKTGSFTAAEGQTLYFPVNGDARDFTAYYPYRETLAEDNVYTVDVKKQTSQKDIDLMGAAKVTGKDKTNPKVAFVFTHKLVKLPFTCHFPQGGRDLTDRCRPGRHHCQPQQPADGCHLQRGDGRRGDRYHRHTGRNSPAYRRTESRRHRAARSDYERHGVDVYRAQIG